MNHPPEPPAGAPLPPKTRLYHLSPRDKVLFVAALVVGALLALWLFLPRGSTPAVTPTPVPSVAPVSTIVGPTATAAVIVPSATPSLATVRPEPTFSPTPQLPVMGSGGLLP